MAVTTKQIGIRELKARASSLVREVAESGTVYQITRHGRPAGLLSPPLDDAPAAVQGSERAWDAIESLAARIRSAPPARRSAVAELSRMRR